MQTSVFTRSKVVYMFKRKLYLFSNRINPSSSNFHAQHLPLIVFGSTTDVGKTVVTAGLCRAALAEGRKVCYIKPIQTGEPDEYFVKFYGNPKGDKPIICRTIHQWLPAMSSHIVADLEGHSEDDKDLVERLVNEISVFHSSAVNSDTCTVVETAGGALSPGPSRNLQADTYRPLRLPVILVGDAKLGGITSTLSVVECLRLRGYTLHAVVVIETDDSSIHGNAKFIQAHLDRSFCGIPGDDPVIPHWSDGHIPKVFSLSALPEGRPLLHNWYKDNDDIFKAVYQHVCASVAIERAGQMEMLREGPKSIWFPFTLYGPKEQEQEQSPSVTQSQSPPPTPINFVDSAYGDNFCEELFDGSASWWTQGVGHGNAEMALAIAEAAGKYGHVLLPGNLHAPVVQLSRYLLQRGPGRGWAQRAYHSDNGSTAMEVALKIGLRLGIRRRRDALTARNRDSTSTSTSTSEEYEEYSMLAEGMLAKEEEGKRLVVLGQKGSYHGDTLGVMVLSPPTTMNSRQHPWYSPRVEALDLPYISFRKGLPVIDVSDLPHTVQVAVNKERDRNGGSGSGSGSWLSMAAILDVEGRAGSELEGVYRQHIRAVLADYETRGLI
eukprot:gene8366-17236_t